MRIVTAALIALTVSPAAADTAFSRSRNVCEVRFVRAPDDVRHVIERWLDAEPRCTSTIDLRVIPTDDGYYLIAQRPDGRIHERLVPDAQSAGVLVASWVADDWVAPHSDPPSPPRPSGPTPALAPEYVTPGMTPAVVVISTPPPRNRGPRWLTVGTLFADNEGTDGGLRVELDGGAWGKLRLGAGFTYTETSMPSSVDPGYGNLRSDDFAASPYLAYALHSDGWELRASGGVGLVYSESSGHLDTSWPSLQTSESMAAVSGLGVIATTSLLVTRRLGDSWGLQAGVYAHSVHVQYATEFGDQVERHDNRAFLFTGLRRRMW